MKQQLRSSASHKPLESRYKQQFPSIKNYRRLNCIQVSGILRFSISNYPKLHFPYDSDKQRLNGHLWQIKLFLSGEESLGVYLVNQMECQVIASYEIKIKNVLSEEEDYVWRDPDGELCFHSYGSGDHYWGTEDLISLAELENPENGFLENDRLVIEVTITSLVSDELRILSTMNSDRDDHFSHPIISTASTSAGPDGTGGGGGAEAGTAAALDRATKQLNYLSEQMSQKVRLLSADALLQDKLIHARLESSSSAAGTSFSVGWSSSATGPDILIPSSAVSVAGSRSSVSPSKSVLTTSQTNIHHSTALSPSSTSHK
jgi:hypothetical protein